MRPSFAHFRSTLQVAICGLVLAVSLAACSSLPPPTGELAAAQQAIARAENADADQYAADAIAQARAEFAQAQSAMARGDDDDARSAALIAAADADLAHARSRAATARAEMQQREAEIAELRARLQLAVEAGDADPLEIPAPPANDPANSTEQRLLVLEADPRLGGHAALERMQARQAIEAAATARSSQRALAGQVAERRVAIAELAARSAAARARIDRLDRERSELLVEASRQDAARARAEAERLRMEAQIQLEEAQRLRAAAESEAAARAAAEEVILDVAGEQADKLAAARRREAELARQEAALLAGGDLPPSSTDARGEVFTLAGDAFPSGSASLTAGATASLHALAAYLQAGGDAKVRIEGHTDGQGEAAANQALSQRRAEAVRSALVSAGLPAARLQAVGRGEEAPVADNGSAGGRARNRRVEIVVSGE
jgi:outer membrane protein OmpA-like peptidoglycan-associated protein